MLDVHRVDYSPEKAIEEIKTSLATYQTENKNAVIESLIMQLPIGPFWANYTGDKTMPLKCLKGDKRLNAIKEYLNNEFDLQPVLLPDSFKGKYFKDLTPQCKKIIQQTWLMFYIVGPSATPKELAVLSRRLNTKD